MKLIKLIDKLNEKLELTYNPDIGVFFYKEGVIYNIKNVILNIAKDKVIIK